MRYRTREIAKTFQDYYGELYSINKKNTPVEAEKKTGENKSLPKRYSTKISEDKCSDLEAPITEDEIKKTLKEIPVGKSPGPHGLTILYYTIKNVKIY